MLKRVLTAFTMIALLALLSAACSGGSKTPYIPEFTGGPHVSFDKDSIDLGDVPAGQTVQAVFTMRNVGDADLIVDNALTKVVEGCCPSNPNFEHTRLAPGKSGSMTLSMNMGAGMGGPHVFEVDVLSNDPNQPRAHVTVRANFLE